MATNPKTNSKLTSVSQLGFPLKTNEEIFPTPAETESFRDTLNAVGIDHAFIARQVVRILLEGGTRADALTLIIAQKLYPKDFDPNYVEPEFDFVNMTNEEAGAYLSQFE